MDEKLTKSLTDLIDETLQELEELRKSRFAATEIELEGPGEKKLAGKPTNGELDAKKSEEEDEEEDKKKKKKQEKEEEEIDKAEEDMDEEEDKDEEDDEEEDEDSMSKKEDKKKEKHPYKKETAEAAKQILDMHKSEMKKSLQESETLIKSYVDERIKPIEDKLSTILDLVNKLSEQPVPPKGLTARAVPLLKSADEAGEPLNKTYVVNKLLELKKSGTYIDSLDIAKVEMGQDIALVAKKYNLN